MILTYGVTAPGRPGWLCASSRPKGKPGFAPDPENPVAGARDLIRQMAPSMSNGCWWWR